MGWVPLPRSFPISWYCKLDTGMHEPNLHPELQMQHKVASGLAAQTCQFDRRCTNLAWCSFPGEPLCQRIHLISPHKNLQDSSQRNKKTKIPGQHTWRVIPPQFNLGAPAVPAASAAAAVPVAACRTPWNAAEAKLTKTGRSRLL